MATRTLNVLLTGDSAKMNAAFSSAVSSSKLAKAGIVGAAAATAVAVGKALFDIGSEFDAVSDKLRATTGKTGKSLERLEANVKNVAKEVPASFMEVTEAVADLDRRLGLGGKPLERRTKQFIELSRITGEDLTGNIKSVARAFEDAEVPIGKQAEKLDELWRASTKSGASVDELSTLMAKFGSPLRQVGINFDESLAMFAEFEKAGVNIQTMMPGLRMALKSFLLEDKDPGKALRAAFKGIEDGSISTSEALELFGQRAGADMIEAVEQGRFHLAGFQKQIEDGNETIVGAGEKTKDASERFQEMGNRIKVLVAPAAEALFNAIGELMKAINSGNFRPFLRSLGLTGKEIRRVEDIAKGLADAFKQYVLPVIKTVIAQVSNVLKGWVQIIAGVVRAIGALLHGEFGKAWKAVKEIFSGYLKAIVALVTGFSAPLRKAASFIGEAIGNAFKSAWAGVKSVFVDGANAVISVINSVLDAIDVIPGVPHWHVNPVGGGAPSQPGGSGSRSAEGGKRGGGRARGSYVHEGAPRGDTVPAMLEHGEYVLNRNAVSAVGKRRLDELNFRVAPRGMQFGGLADVVGTAGDVLGTAGEIYTAPVRLPIEAAIGAAKSAGQVIKGLPSGNIGGAFAGVGPWIIDRISKWIKGWFSSHASKVGGGSKGPKGIGSYMGVPMANWVIESLQYAASKGAAPQPTSGYRSHAYNVSQGRTYFSEHEKTQYPGGAVDFGGYTSGLSAKMSVVNATRGFKYPLLAPIGFRDDGHASGTGHALGGLVRRMASGGSVVATAAGVMKRNGLTANAIGGILGNAFGESSWNPAAMEGNLHNGGLWGFTASPVSLSDLEAYASSQGKPWTDVATQTQFMLHHLPDSLKAKLNSAGSVAEAATLFINEWEHPLSTSSLPTRIAYGEKALRMLGGQKGIQGLKGGGGGGNKGGAAKPKHEGAAGIGQGEAFVRLAAGKVPEVLQGAGVGAKIRSLFSAPGLTREGRWSASEMGLEVAAGTKGTADETALYQWQAGVADSEAGTLEKQIANINHQLTTRELRPSQRKHLLERRANLLGKLATARQRGKGAREGLAGEGAAADAGVGDGGVETLASALAANTAELEATRHLAETATQVKSAEAWRALADILSGHLGARVSLYRKTAGAGKQGTF